MSIEFALSDEQAEKVAQWRRDCRRRSVERQKATPPEGVPRELLESCWEDGHPYGGAIGGGTTYSFTPTSVGVVVKVHDSHLDETIDVSDYDNW